jgi:hypothetical protein
MNFSDDSDYFTKEERDLFRKLEENGIKEDKLVKLLGKEKDEKEFENLLISYQKLAQEGAEIILILAKKIEEDIEEIKRMEEEENDGEDWKPKGNNNEK